MLVKKKIPGVEQHVWRIGVLMPCGTPAAFVSGRRRIVGSEEARLRASLRPPPKLPVHISRRQLSPRLSNAGMQEIDQSNKLVLAVKLGHRQPFPARIAPTPVPMRPDASPDPAVETLEELSDVGAFVVLAPAPQERIKFRNQLRGVQRSQPFGSLPDLIHETTDRFLLGIRIQRTLSGLTTNLTRRQMKLPLPTLDFVAKELEALADVNNPRFLRM